MLAGEWGTLERLHNLHVAVEVIALESWIIAAHSVLTVLLGSLT